jgi:hypothetical protein
MDGLYINGARPKSKKAVKEALTNVPESVIIEYTSMHGEPGPDSPLDLRPGTKIHFVGPDPYTKRVFYGTIQRTTLGFKVT